MLAFLLIFSTLIIVYTSIEAQTLIEVSPQPILILDSIIIIHVPVSDHNWSRKAIQHIVTYASRIVAFTDV